MKDNRGIHLRAVNAFCRAYHEKKQSGEISREQLEEISKLLDNLENYSYEEVKMRLQEIFPGYQPQEIPLFRYLEDSKQEES